MEWLNYHHLLYFWTAAREGSVTRAAAKLRLSQPTISAQIRQLEDALGERLFQRQGRALVLTATGRTVLDYADEIFGLGRELLDTLNGRAPGRSAELRVGVADAVPKLVVYRLLLPATRGPVATRLVCREDDPERLVTQLANHTLDVVLADTPAPPHVRVKVFNHLLGESGTAFFAGETLAQKLKSRFPSSLHQKPVYLPTANTALRRDLEVWFERVGIRPSVVGEFEDSALMKTFGQGTGVVFPAPAAIAKDICRVYDVREVGRTDAVRERYYAISAERRVKHPAVFAITTTARGALFGP